jgi:hypothetical protein
MATLSQPDPTAAIACTLPVSEAHDRLVGLQRLVGDRLSRVNNKDGRLRIRIERGSMSSLEAEAVAFAEAEKSCCAFLGFAVESEPDAVTIEIAAPTGAEPTLESIAWMVRAAARAEEPA